MDTTSQCLGHQQRDDRQEKIDKLAKSELQPLDKDRKVLIKKGPVSTETSLEEVEEIYENKPEWKAIEEGAVLCVPVEEFRMTNLPKPDRSGKVVFGKKKVSRHQIDSYSASQTIEHLNENKTISDGGITVDFSIIKVHTSN